MVRLLAVVAVALKAWMFIDAVRRKADSHWFWTIAFVPFGEFVYFFAVKLRDPGMARLQRRMLDTLKRPPTVAELRYAFERSPSLTNEIRLDE